MWIALGIVSLIGFFAYRFWRKYFWAWGWTDDPGLTSRDGRRYKSRHSENNGTHRFGYAVTAPPGLYFRVKRETRWDRWAKRLGLSVEQQLGDPGFDDHLYLVSDDPVWCAELAQVQGLRRVVKALFLDSNLRTLTCEGRHLWAEVELHSQTTPLDYLNGQAKRNIVAALHGIADNLEFLAKQHGPRRRDPYALRAMLLVSLSSALFMLAAVELFRIFWLERGQVMIDGIGLLGFSALATLIVLFVLLTLAAAWLRGSSHAHIVMLEILFSGGLGLFMSSYALARDANCNWEQAVATPHIVTVSHKSTGYRRKYGTYYTLHFDAAAARADLPSSIEVDARTYGNAVQGDHVVIFVRPGALGYRWVEAIQHP
ncbi:MAG: hypothetical protein AB1831_06915 [Pseudomonadota bacterium]